MNERKMKLLGTLQDYGDTNVDLLVDSNENALYIAIPVYDDYQYAIVKVLPEEVLSYMKDEVPLIQLFENRKIILSTWGQKSTLDRRIPFDNLEDDLEDMGKYQSEFGHEYNLIISFLISGYDSLMNQPLQTVKA